MAEYDLKYLQKKIKEELSEDRYEHTIGVMYTAESLAMRYGVDMTKAAVAGLLHDCAKCIPNNEKIELCEKNNLLISAVERENPSLLHAKLGAHLAEKEYDITDPSILHAIVVHTTGEPDMNTLDKIIYIADYIEPGRDKAPNLEKVRELAFSDLNRCMAQILRDTLQYLVEKGGTIDPATQLTYDFYKQYEEE